MLHVHSGTVVRTQCGRGLGVPKTVCAKPDPSLLRTGRDHRKAHTRQVRSRRRFAQPMLSVHDRGFEPTDRTVAGHWEGDLIVGPNHRSGTGTLVERQTRFVKLVHLPVQDSATLHAALVAALAPIPAGLRRSLTWDQGTEMARHPEVAADAGIKIYFCDAGSPWQRGTNENTVSIEGGWIARSVRLVLATRGDSREY